MHDNFNGLTPAETERIALLVEEMGEVQQVLGKILRHGYESNWEGGPTNRESLHLELGDVLVVLQMMAEAGDIHESSIEERIEVKMEKIKRFLHHQD